MTRTVVLIALAVAAAGHLLVGAWAAAAPQSFATQLADFGNYNAHLVRDFAICTLTFGAGLAVAIRVRSWRVPAIGLDAIWHALHAINHWADVHLADRPVVGWGEALLLTALAVGMGGLAAVCARAGVNNVAASTN
jgi:hypothetical protein